MIEGLEATVRIPMGLSTGRRVAVSVDGGYPPPGPAEMVEIGSLLLQMFSGMLQPPPAEPAHQHAEPAADGGAEDAEPAEES